MSPVRTVAAYHEANEENCEDSNVFDAKDASYADATECKCSVPGWRVTFKMPVGVEVSFERMKRKS